MIQFTTIQSAMRSFPTVVFFEDGEFVAQALGVSVASSGDSREQALDNLREAIELYYDGTTPAQEPRDVSRVSLEAVTVDV